MSEVYLGQIMMAGFEFSPKDFAPCNGQLMNVNVYPALFALLGIRYGGDGIRTFGLPDLRGRTPVGAGTSVDAAWQPAPYQNGDRAGVEKAVLTALPSHTHTLRASSKSEGAVRSPVNALYCNSGSEFIYAPANSPQVTLAASTVTGGGSGSGHENMQPFQTVNFVIALNGIFPSRS